MERLSNLNCLRWLETSMESLPWHTLNVYQRHPLSYSNLTKITSQFLCYPFNHSSAPAQHVEEMCRPEYSKNILK